MKILVKTVTTVRKAARGEGSTAKVKDGAKVVKEATVVVTIPAQKRNMAREKDGERVTINLVKMHMNDNK